MLLIVVVVWSVYWPDGLTIVGGLYVGHTTRSNETRKTNTCRNAELQNKKNGGKMLHPNEYL